MSLPTTQTSSTNGPEDVASRPSKTERIPFAIHAKKRAFSVDKPRSYPLDFSAPRGPENLVGEDVAQPLFRIGVRPFSRREMSVRLAAQDREHDVRRPLRAHARAQLAALRQELDDERVRLDPPALPELRLRLQLRV